jgi:hypothetical protein
MLFVALLKAKAGTSQERMARRLQWQHPEEVRPIAEYWLQSSEVTVVTIFEADSVQPIMAVSVQWADVFDITVVPAMTAEEGLQWAQQMMQQQQGQQQGQGMRTAT